MHTYFTFNWYIARKMENILQINHHFKEIGTGRQEAMKFNLCPTKNPSYGH